MDAAVWQVGNEQGKGPGLFLMVSGSICPDMKAAAVGWTICGCRGKLTQLTEETLDSPAFGLCGFPPTSWPARNV
jgi:hypothetical protein